MKIVWRNMEKGWSIFYNGILNLRSRLEDEVGYDALTERIDGVVVIKVLAIF
jgi:hypothetical protein